MRKKILLLSLIALLSLPVLGITQDVRVDDVEIRWIPLHRSGYEFRAKVWVTNDSDADYRVSGKLIFYDPDGFVLRRSWFSGKVDAGKSIAFHCRGYFGERDRAPSGTYEAIITSQRPIRW